jgi:uncharacterized protein YwgA
MLIEDIILTLIHLSDNSLKGKTLLQKQVYFISVFLEKDFGYRPHYYGPYSPIVDTSLMKLKSLGFINENVSYWGYDYDGFDKKSYEFSLTDNGNKLFKLFKKTERTTYNKIERIYNNMMKTEGTKNYVTLSVAAKLFYILKSSGSKLSKNEMIAEAKSYGWNISNKSVVDGVNILKALELT